MTALITLIADWQDALWTELQAAYENQHMDASHDIRADYLATVRGGVDAYLADLFLEGERLTWDDHAVDALSSETEFRARLVQVARDQGMDAAMLYKLSDGALDPRKSEVR